MGFFGYTPDSDFDDAITFLEDIIKKHGYYRPAFDTAIKNLISAHECEIDRAERVAGYRD